MEAKDFWLRLINEKSVSKITVSNELILPKYAADQTLVCVNCDFNGDVIISGFKTRIEFNNCRFSEKIEIRSAVSSTEAVFINCTILNINSSNISQDYLIEIKGEKKNQELLINEIKIRNARKCIIENQQIKELMLEQVNKSEISNSIINNLRSEKFYLLLNGSKIDNLYTENMTELKIRDNIIDEINLRGKYGELDLRFNTINFLNFISFECVNSGFITDCTINDSLKFHQSLVNKLIFNNCDLSRSLMEVQGTSLFDTKFDSISWNNKPFINRFYLREAHLDKVFTDDSTGESMTIGKDHPFYKDMELKTKSFTTISTFPLDKKLFKDVKYRNKIRNQHIYRHLKHTALEAEDKINFYKFKAFELDNYMRTLRWSKRSEFATKLSLFLGRYTNFYGLKWFPPIWQYLLISLIIFILMSGFKLPFITCVDFHVFLADFARILNPTHNINDLQLNYSSALAIFFDYIGRIIQGFLAFQTIVGFRRVFYS